MAHLQDSWIRNLMMGASMVALTGAGSVAYAQDAEIAESDDEIIVTGIRQSLKKSMDLKKNAKGIVDAISAEDIGKFPDTNLAESLQRITGVSIDRENGEGARVTVRGFGPEFNLVTFNGRQMPTASLGDGASPPSSRSFDFGNIASEGISAVEVYKTTKASVASGGIGSVLNIRTTKPLDSPGMNATVGLKGVYDTSQNEGTDITPEISGLYSNTFADDKFGVALSGSFQKRNYSHNQANVGWRDGYLGSDAYENEWGRLPRPGSWNFIDGVTNPPGPTDVYEVPQNANYAFTDFERERINGQLVLQYRPIDTLTLSADFTYAKNEIEARTSDVGVWFNHGFTQSAWTDGPVAGPLFYSEDFGGGPSDLSYGGALTANQTENKSLGFNAEWDVSDNLSLWADVHTSSAESKPTNRFGSNVSVGTAVYGLQTQTVNFENDLPIISFTNAPGIDTQDISNRVATGNAFRNAFQRTEIDQFQAGGSFEVDRDIIDSVDFGASLTQNNVRSAFGFIQNDTWGGSTTPEQLPDDIFEQQSIPDRFSGVSGANNPALVQTFHSFDFERMVELLEGLNGICDAAPVAGTCLAEYTTDRRIQEDTLSGYLQVNTSWEWGNGLEANLIAGARYEETKVDSAALVPVPNGTIWGGPNEFNLVFPAGASDFTSSDGKYDYFLPSVDFDTEIFNNAKLRASYGRSIARPTYENLQGGLTLDQLFRIGEGSGRSGNPGLLPFVSENLDFSAEWYYDVDSYISIGFFNKDVKNFIGSTTVDRTVDGIFHPGLGARAQAAAAALGTNDLAAIRDYIIANFPSTVNAAGQPTGQSDDPLVNFRITQPLSNDESANLNGWEFALQHTFGESGFGLIANYTIVNGDVRYDNTLPYNVPQFSLTGLSDSANLVGFYDKNGIQARIAYNWRDEFLAGNGPNPFYREAFGQVDVSASYEFKQGFTVFAEGINVLDQQLRGHRRHQNNVFFVHPGNARYAAGVRYTF